MNPPKANKRTHIHSIHGHDRDDDYFWMRERDTEEVLTYLEAENAYAEYYLSDVKELREKLFEEIKGRIQEKDMSVPYDMDGHTYFTRFEEGDEYARHFRKRIGSHSEELILDENKRAKDAPFYNLATRRVSPSGNMLCLGEDFVGRRQYQLTLKHSDRDTYLSDLIQDTDGNGLWSSDEKAIYYLKKDPDTLRPFQLYRHFLGEDSANDQLVFEEIDDIYHVGISLSKSRKYLLLHAESTNTSECHFLDLSDNECSLRCFQERTNGLEYEIDHIDDHFYVLHNREATNFKLSKVRDDLSHGMESWVDVIPHRQDTFLEEFELFDSFLAIQERESGLTSIRILPDSEFKQAYNIPFEENAFTVYLHQNPDPTSTKLRIGYTSLTTPSTVYDYHLSSGELEQLKQVEVLGDFSSADYFSERLQVRARDGEEVPVSIVYKKGIEEHRNSPLLLYGYGSYGISVDPYFSHARLSLLDRGFAFAIAHIRGGQVKGRPWYEKGKLQHKMNTFTDFIDVADFLVENAYVAQDKLYAMGGSAGGLLMGAVMNMRPELWKGIVAQVPFVDVMTTMLDASIPLTTGEYTEWGNPNIEEDYYRMLEYSPYDNITSKNYPSLLITSGYHDSQVQYWEPTKWAAKLREQKTDQNPLLLVTEMKAGHGGASGRFTRLKEVALEYAFLLKMEGITA